MLDTLIVGARCAGATLAIHLARAGKRVLAIDASNLPSDQPLSTHWISPYGMALLDELGLGDKVRSFAPPVPSMIYGNDDMRGRIEYPVGGRCSCPRRMDLDALLLEEARASGAEVRTLTRLVGLLRDGERVTGAVVEHDGVREEIRARVVVGADGPHSTTAELVGAEEYHGYDCPRAMYWAYWPRPDWFDSDPRYQGGAMNCTFGDDVVFVFPTNRDLLLIGVAFPKMQLPEWKGCALEKLMETLKDNDHTAPLIAGEPASKVLGALKLRFFFRQAAGPGWALVGDAGLFMDPSPGFGITDALRDARALGRAIVEDDDQALVCYWRQRDATSIDLFEYSRGRGALGHNNPLSRILYGKLATDPVLQARLLASMNRQCSPFAVFDPSDIKKWADEAIARGETGVIQPLIDMSRRGEAIRAEMALRQRLVEEAHARRAQASGPDDIEPFIAGADHDIRVRESI
ncbi:NAD(P)/FAD-dependent oxidoreductase [Burkholderia contaminans]|uniref:NAD(P)/FAD-dependent oxidoreductase n=3 Tax=Bacteria TaxID=2 RepID=A0AAP4VFA7_9BURK|nr:MULTISPECIES: NAD(P)/FAD-dependent oxidoreductase [Burkholderia]MBD1414018.1 NAD(P)/FAD-dependent oxidoreductase [Burkholderia contaminans]MBH9665677.1 NAD(P)/FAD-dependent oxidoreductase [Burkholderia contaminans]MBH9674773.1 NAD(P)/FAD-dependent oxidoreductase [Burkholderia contaminans]MBH9704819.1 NAD(P)/FAD-dependent oxidoreductase [Burkholderia contaminans]MBH9722932.1 NAD(P)/FAD-dependent oxidoreductase [Burkholderia contaminans]